jgi:hypothetical protein
MLNKKIVLVIFLIVLLGCATTYTPEMVQHIKGSSFKATTTGYYTAELVMKPKEPKVGENKAHLIIHDFEATDIPGLKITVTPFLPEKGIQSDKNPKVNDAGRGLYIIEDIYFSEPGNWQVKIEIRGPYKDDTVVLSVPEVK